MMADRAGLLVLGGTTEAVDLANRAAADCAADYAITYSLAGRTRSPSLPAGVSVRTGGFGGAEALADWIADNAIGAVVDATHPFAGRIARNAADACRTAGIPRLKLLRPAWKPVAGDRWQTAADLDSAARMLPETGSTAFLSVGRQELNAFSGLEHARFLIRTIDPLPNPPLANATCLTGRGPFTVDQEIDLFRKHGIDMLVSKNAGGPATYAKIEAARRLSLPVIMVDRPPPVAGETVEDADAAISWLANLH